MSLSPTSTDLVDRPSLQISVHFAGRQWRKKQSEPPVHPRYIQQFFIKWVESTEDPGGLCVCRWRDMREKVAFRIAQSRPTTTSTQEERSRESLLRCTLLYRGNDPPTCSSPIGGSVKSKKDAIYARVLFRVLVIIDRGKEDSSSTHFTSQNHDIRANQRLIYR